MPQCKECSLIGRCKIHWLNASMQRIFIDWEMQNSLIVQWKAQWLEGVGRGLGNRWRSRTARPLMMRVISSGPQKGDLCPKICLCSGPKTCLNLSFVKKKSWAYAELCFGWDRWGKLGSTSGCRKSLLMTSNYAKRIKLKEGGRHAHRASPLSTVDPLEEGTSHVTLLFERLNGVFFLERRNSIRWSF